MNKQETVNGLKKIQKECSKHLSCNKTCPLHTESEYGSCIIDTSGGTPNTWDIKEDINEKI